MMLTAFLLGLTGSVTHCVGMCSGVSLMLWRRAEEKNVRSLLLLNLGRITTYALLGLLAGGLGLAVGAGGHHHQASQSSGFNLWQGGVALLMALAAAYMALAILGKTPSPEHLFGSLTRRWGRLMRSPRRRKGNIFGLGLLWGLLPCGLVLAALLTAVSAAAPLSGALAMLAFGLGTWPATLAVGAAGQRLGWQRRLRPLSAILLGLFAFQMTLRGLAAWGVVAHLSINQLMLW